VKMTRPASSANAARPFMRSSSIQTAGQPALVSSTSRTGVEYLRHLRRRTAGVAWRN
jgi:hypothetical protein